MQMFNLHCRSFLPELMDTGNYTYVQFKACLSDIRRINRWTYAYQPTLTAVEALYRQRPSGLSPLTVVDVGFGAGDMLARLAQLARRKHLHLRLLGIDINPWAVQVARELNGPDTEVDYCCGDYRRYAFTTPIDVVISSLFTHHLDDRQIVQFITWMNRVCRIGWFISDIHRHALPYHGIVWLSRLRRLSPMVRNDAPLSVARSFRRRDWRSYLSQVANAHFAVDVRWRFPFKYTVSARRERSDV